MFRSGPVAGSLVINDNASLRDIEGMRSLTAIAGSVEITDNESLRSVDGLRAFSSVGGDLSVSGNQNLTDIDGLGGLDSVGGDLTISSNDKLIHLDGLLSLTEVGGDVSISSNTLLRDLQGLDLLQTVGGAMRLRENPALSEISGMQRLAEVGGSLDISSNSGLITMSGWNQLGVVTGPLHIDNNPSLTEITTGAFARLRTIGSLSVRYNQALAHLDGLRKIEAIASYLDVFGNYRLSDCKGLAYVLGPGSVEGSVNIYNNNYGCNSAGEIAGSIVPPTQAEIIDVTSSNRQLLLRLAPSKSAEPLFPVSGYDLVCDGITARKQRRTGAMLADNAPISERIRISSEALISAVELDVDISHSDPSDLFVSITSPTGTEKVLWDGDDSNTENLEITFGSGVGAQADDSGTISFYPRGPATYTSSSVVTDGGWELCYQSTYSTHFYQSDVESACPTLPDTKFLVACRETNSDILRLLAAAPASDVFKQTSGNTAFGQWHLLV